MEPFSRDIGDVHMRREGTPGRGGILGFHGELAAVAGDEILIEVTGGLLVILDAQQPQI